MFTFRVSEKRGRIRGTFGFKCWFIVLCRLFGMAFGGACHQRYHGGPFLETPPFTARAVRVTSGSAAYSFYHSLAQNRRRFLFFLPIGSEYIRVMAQKNSVGLEYSQEYFLRVILQ